MKILFIGFLALFSWSILSTYIYVCKINGFCNESTETQNGKANDKNIIIKATKSKPLTLKQSVYPRNLVIYFEFDKSDLEADAGTDKYFKESNNYLDQNAQAMINITGYTDAIGSEDYNQALGYKRAKSMQHYLESKGIPANKISIKSNGENEPADDNTSIVGRATNRRTIVTLKK